jgi:two-component system response regulator YesN
MRIQDHISQKEFGDISRKYFSRTGLPLVLADLEGHVHFNSRCCRVCHQLMAHQDRGLNRKCRMKMVLAVREAYRWGEGYITTCPAGLIIFAVPLIIDKRLVAVLLSGFAIFPEMKKDIREEIAGNLKDFGVAVKPGPLARLRIRVLLLEDVRTFISFLLALTHQHRLNDLAFLKEINERYVRQYKIANVMEELKKKSPEDTGQIFDKQNEIIQLVKLGDKTGAREILNEFLGSIFFQSGMNFEIIKVRLIELVVMISRAAIEAGGEAKELLGLNYSYLTDLNKATDLEELLFKVTEILENFIHKVSLIKMRKKTIRMDAVREYIQKNFAHKISARDAAGAAGLSTSRTLHLFKEVTHQSLSGYIQKLRIDHGKRLLLHSDLDIADVAVEAGFYDQSHFSKAFKKATRIPPARFRRKYKPAAAGAGQ